MNEASAGPPKPLGSLLDEAAGLDPAARALPIHGIAADSRKVRPGSLFAALSGTKADGAAYVPEAVARGAAAVLIAEDAPLGDVGVPLIRVADPPAALARAAAAFFGAQPATVVAVTGTNGKTSVAVFTRQIWEATGGRAASLGTIGLVAPGGNTTASLTTPDAVTLHETLAALARDGVTHLALEASSHGLVQRRLDGVRLTAGAFTNLSRDHLDYHGTLEAYLEAKLRLFQALLPEGAVAVVNADAPEAPRILDIARERRLRFLSFGSAGEALRLVAAERRPGGTRLVVEAGGEAHEVALPLVGSFQVANALAAAGLAVATGVAPAAALRALSSLKGASGRLEHVGDHASGAPVFVDYAHTPEALENVITALRPHVARRLVVIIGAGGDRDAGKRPLMGEAASRHADLVIVTDDNPRSEDPAAIRRAVLEGAPGALEIADRAEAIRQAVRGLENGDVLLIAGKGHETGQIIGDRVLPFSDQGEARSALQASGG